MIFLLPKKGGGFAKKFLSYQKEDQKRVPFPEFCTQIKI